MAEKITAEVKTYEGTGFVVIGGSYSGGMPPDIAAEVARRINCAPELAEACETVLEHVEDEDAPRVLNQCTLCKTYRHVLRCALAAYRGT